MENVDFSFVVVADVGPRQHGDDGGCYGDHDPAVRDGEVVAGGQQQGPAVNVEGHQAQADHGRTAGQQDAGNISNFL